MTTRSALPLFAADLLPEGLIHEPRFLGQGEQDALLTEIRRLEFGEVRLSVASYRSV